MRFYLSFLILLSSLSITLTSVAVVDPNKKVTKEYITNICSKASDGALCVELLSDLIGHPVVKITFEILAMQPMDKAEPLARNTYRMIEHMHATLNDPARGVRERYWKCMKEYSTAMKYLRDARGMFPLASRRGFMQQIRIKKVKSYASSAANRVNACDKYFAKPPKNIPFNLKNANRKFKDLCSAIVSICSKM